MGPAVNVLHRVRRGRQFERWMVSVPFRASSRPGPIWASSTVWSRPSGSRRSAAAAGAGAPLCRSPAVRQHRADDDVRPAADDACGDRRSCRSGPGRRRRAATPIGRPRRRRPGCSGRRLRRAPPASRTASWRCRPRRVGRAPRGLRDPPPASLGVSPVTGMTLTTSALSNAGSGTTRNRRAEMAIADRRRHVRGEQTTDARGDRRRVLHTGTVPPEVTMATNSACSQRRSTTGSRARIGQAQVRRRAAEDGPGAERG